MDLLCSKLHNWSCWALTESSPRPTSNWVSTIVHYPVSSPSSYHLHSHLPTLAFAHRHPTTVLFPDDQKLHDIIIQLPPDTHVATYASLLRLCTLQLAPSQGELVHDLIIRRGYSHNLFLNNLLVQMYGKCGRLQQAHAVFDNMGERNLYSWTIMLAALAQNGHGKVALQLFRRMQAEDIQPNKITSICVLDACASDEALEEGREVHTIIVGNGWESDVVVGTALVNVYGKCRSLDDARAVFAKMPERNVVSWSAMISASTNNGDGKKAFELLGQMQADGLEPDKITCICILDACAIMETLKDGQDMHAHVVGNGWESDVVLGTTLITMYGKCGSVDDARSVFAEIPQKNVVLWSAMIAEYAQNGLGKVALQLFSQMQSEGFEPDKITFTCILDACASLAVLEQGQGIHASLVGNEWDSDVIVGTALVNMYGKCGSLDDASAVFAEIPKHSVISWSAMITACALNGHGKEALQLYNQMQADGFEPDKITSLCALDACASVAALEEGQAIHSNVVANGWESDVTVGTTLANMYGKARSLDDAKAVFAEMASRDLISWNAMITSCAQNADGVEALQVFSQMQAEGFQPNRITFTCVLDACASVGALDEGREIHASTVANGWESDVAVGTAIVNMYGKCGSLADASIVFTEMPQHSVVSWSAMMAVCAQHGHCKEVLQLFGQMQEKGFKPDEISFICVLTACNHMGLVADGMRYFTSMSQDHGISPLVEHYVCMIDLLGRAGQMDKAEQLINSMPFEPINSAWLSLLSSCRIHSDLERGVRAANYVLDLDKNNDSPYVLLANIHAAAGKWDDEGRTRKAMIYREMNKVPSHGYIEVKNVVHESIAHLPQEQIYAESPKVTMWRNHTKCSTEAAHIFSSYQYLKNNCIKPIIALKSESICHYLPPKSRF